MDNGVNNSAESDDKKGGSAAGTRGDVDDKENNVGASNGEAVPVWKKKVKWSALEKCSKDNLCTTHYCNKDNI